jgi:CHAT domain-containing protein
LRAEALTRLARYDAAARALDEAEKSGSVNVLIDLRRGALLTILNETERARQILTRALDGAKRIHDGFLEATVMNQLAINRIRAYRYDEALTFAQGAIEQAQQSGARRVEAAALANTSICYSRLGDFERAHQFSERSTRMFEQIGDQQSFQAGLGFRGNIYMFEDDARNAVAYYRRALDIARRLKAEAYVATWTANLAQALGEMGDWAGAAAMNRQAAGGRPEDEQAKVSAKLTAARIEGNEGNHRQAITTFASVIAAAPANPWQRWEAHAGLADAFAQSGNPSRAAAEFERAIQMVETTRGELPARDQRLTFLSHLVRFYGSYVEFLMQRREPAKAFLVAERSRARIWAERLGGTTRPGREWPLTRYVDTAKKTGTYYLSYWVGRRRSFLWVIGPDGLHACELPGEEPLATLIRSYQSSIQDLRSTLRIEAAAELYRILLAPAKPFVPAGARVVLTPDGPLLNLNFETLPAAPDRYWIEDVTASIAPAIEPGASFSPAVHRSPRLLLVGAAETVGPEYPKLVHAMDEIVTIARRYPNAQTMLLTGARATPPDFFGAHPETYSIIHFAAHGIANRSSPLDSAIVLSNKNGSFLLYAREILDRKLNADLVTLAACRSAGAKSFPGEGLVGLAWAFLHAGANNVVGTLWNVTDRSTGELMSVFYSELAAGREPADALRTAKLALLHSRSAWRNPYYWGAFQMYQLGKR